jgi:hypothetical protein
MPRAPLAAAFVLAAGCSPSAIGMHLSLPDASATQGFDLSCVSAVAVRVVGNDIGNDTHPADTIDDCVDLASPPQSFADVQRDVAGKFSFSIPESGLAGVQLAGFKGSCNDHIDSHEAVFYGGAPRVDGSDSLILPLVPNITCNAGRNYQVRVVDLTVLTATDLCSTPLDASNVYAADLRPRLLGGRMPRMTREIGVSSVDAPDGKGTVASYAGTIDDRSCIAIDYRGTLSGGVACVNPTAPTLCAATGEIEVGSLPLLVTSGSRDAALAARYGEPVYGAVYEAEAGTSGPRTALAGATVELSDPAQGTIVYVDFSSEKLTALPGATSTNDDGLFIAYIQGTATNLVVKAPGHTQQTLRVASAPEWPSIVVAALPKQ